MEKNNIVLSLVSESNTRFINQVKLCLFSFRKNAGSLKNIPIHLITNDRPLPEDVEKYFVEKFSPITFSTSPRIGPINIPHACKWKVFDLIDYDVVIFLDCDTVVVGELDDMLNPIINGGCEFLCRRGGKTDCESFKNIDKTLEFLNCADSKCFVNGERPMFNSGVFAFQPKVGKIIKDDALNILPKLDNNHLKNRWAAEQVALALSCIKNNINVEYLDEMYNSWGNVEDIKILHCFKSRYKFNRINMFENFNIWKHQYTEVIGERLLTKTVEEFILEQ
jgi:lipopolysaccharide biosynthesis glycosyltransferase